MRFVAIILAASLVSGCFTVSTPDPRLDPGGEIDKAIAELRRAVERLNGVVGPGGEIRALITDAKRAADAAGQQAGYYDITLSITHDYSQGTGCEAGHLTEPGPSFVSQTFCRVPDHLPLSCKNLFKEWKRAQSVENIGVRVRSRSTVEAVYCRISLER